MFLLFGNTINKHVLHKLSLVLLCVCLTFPERHLQIKWESHHFWYKNFQGLLPTYVSFLEKKLLAISYTSLSCVKNLFRDYQGHIQIEISIVEFSEHPNGLFLYECCFYDKKYFYFKCRWVYLTIYLLNILRDTLSPPGGENCHWALNGIDKFYYTSYINFTPQSLQKLFQFFCSPDPPPSFFPCPHSLMKWLHPLLSRENRRHQKITCSSSTFKTINIPDLLHSP